jgi:23S rRNA (cytosine1962-C5)-methyltransferase
MTSAGPNLDHLPRSSEKNIALHIKKNAEQKIRQGHPWLFAQAIQKQSHAGQPGDLAVIFDHKRRFLAIGLYDPLSSIRVRVLQHGKPAAINQAWFEKKFQQAMSIRSALPENTNGYRLIHGENDGFPGLVLDKYGHTLVLKIYSLAWIPFLRDLLPLCLGLSPERIILRLGREVQQHPEHLHNLEDGSLLWGSQPEGAFLFLENGITFEVDPIEGQKTGFFLDQRDNRAIVGILAANQSVLNIFSYTGGFSLYAARGNARSVTSVDISQPALDAADRNFAHNREHPAIAACNHQTIQGDAFSVLAQLADDQKKFDVVIIDPPSFASNKKESLSGLRAYRRLTRMGLKVLAAGGMLVQASCSSRISPQDFLSAIHQQADLAGRKLNQIEFTAHALDHPIGFPEGEYLKCIFAEA